MKETTHRYFFYSCYICLGALLLFPACQPKEQAQESELIQEDTAGDILVKVKPEDFEKTIDGKKVGLFTISNQNGLEAIFTNYGQRLVSLYVPDNKGEMKDIVLGFSTLEEYQNAHEKYFGAVIGRYGNRIAKGKFSIDGEDYSLAVNNGENHLHGGEKGFHNVVWDAQQINDHAIEFTRTSPDMEEGYPGNLEVKVTYTLTDANELKITYEASTDQKTFVNLTHHSFFNLKGEGEGDINEHILMINAEHYTPVDKGLIPNGNIAEVSGSPFDFTSPKSIGQDLNENQEQLVNGSGYDHNFVLKDNPKNEDSLVLAARVEEPSSGRVMEVYTDEPGLQFYGGNFLNGEAIGKSGQAYVRRGAFCLETQHFPDSPNQSNFPSTLLEPGEMYTSTCVYKFTTLNK